MNGTTNGNGTTAGRGIKTLLVTGFLAMTLMFGLLVTAVGVTVVGVAGVAVGAAAGGIVVAHGACTTVEEGLARDLDVDVAELRALTPAAINDRIDARLASKALTAERADLARERADAYDSCRVVFGDDNAKDWHPVFSR